MAMGAKPPMAPGAPALPEAAGLWVTITELAERKGVTKQTISEKVQRFEGDGLITTRRGPGRQKLVNLAEYDRVAGEVTDLAREQAAATVRARREEADGARPTAEKTRTDAERQKALYDAGLRALDYGERVGKLLPIEGATGVAEAMAQAAERMVRALKVSHRANELHGVALKDGEVGVRRLLKAIELELRAAIGREMRLIEAFGLEHEAAGQVEIDLPVPDEDEPL